MPTTTPDGAGWGQRFGPEAMLAVLAGIVFLGFLGSPDLWGKREQRASAEAIDTIDNGHWLVAQIQGRPRLEKPPLPRWTIATLMTITGRRDEWIVRLPGALSALGMVGLVYALGCWLGGRQAGLASALALTSMGFFVAELRQAGNDGPLALFTTLALYAAFRRLDDAPERRGWNLLLYGAAGLGVLCKGPVILMFLALTVVPYLACVGRLREGGSRLIDARGAALFLILALGWPVMVLLNDPNALTVWRLEMGQKTGLAAVPHPHHLRLPLAADWPWMTVPWGVVATLALALPFRKGREVKVWFPWWWAVGNLAAFCVWSVAKPNYYLPGLPGAALLCGLEWVRLTRSAREPWPGGVFGRRVLQGHWCVLMLAAAVGPVAAWWLVPDIAAWTVVAGVVLATAVAASGIAWKRGADAMALAPLVAALAALALIGYGAIAPTQNAARSHRSLASALDRLLPAEAKTVMFFHDMDEGLWFYLRGRNLQAVPGSQPGYNDTYETIEAMRNQRFERNTERRQEARKQVLLSWLLRHDRPSAYLLIRDIEYDRFAPALAGLVEPVYREQGLHRNALVLLRATGIDQIATAVDDAKVRR